MAWVAADTLNSPHPTCISSLAYMSQLDRERGREYVPLYTAPVAAQKADDARDAERYRWLRLRLAGAEHVAELVEYNTDMHPELPGDVDTAIDQARGKENGNG